MFKLIFGKSRLGLGRPLETGRISVNGMTGKASAKTIKKALLTKTGVREVYINREEGVVTVSFDPTLTNIPALNDVILRKGYIAGGAQD
jgi:copper chaperone CopZ